MRTKIVIWALSCITLLEVVNLLAARYDGMVLSGIVGLFGYVLGRKSKR